MPSNPRNKPAGSGPGRGSPRSRTDERPGERVSSGRPRTRPLDAEAVAQAAEERPRVSSSERALGMTWRMLILGVVMAALAVTLAQSLRVYFAQAKEMAQLQQQIDQTKREIATLDDQLARWKDPAFVKAEARTRLGWVVPGETGYRVIGADGKPIGGDSTVLAPSKPSTGMWWQQMWGSVGVADAPAEEK